MKNMNKALTVLLCIVMLLSGNSVQAAQINNGAAYSVSTNEIAGWPQGPDTYAETAILMDADTGMVLYNKGMDELRYPASTTKLLTLLVALENSSLDEQVTFTETCLADQTPDSGNIGMQVGEVLPMEQCLLAMIIQSANDVATQVAEHVGGSVEAFCEMMNQKAAEIGCTNTHFVNASGMPNEEHYTTAHDLARIMQAGLKNQDFRNIIATESCTIGPTNMNPEARTFTTHHPLLASTAPEHYDGCLGGKTGNTIASGHTIVTAVEQNGMTLIAVAMRAEAGQVAQDSIQLFDYGFGNFQKVEVPGGSVVIPNGNTVEQLTTAETAAQDTSVALDYYYNEDYYVGSGVEETVTETPAPTQEALTLTPEATVTPEADSPREIQETDDSVFRTAALVLVVLIVLAVIVTVVSAVRKKNRRKKKRKN
ncbi:MAG: D-alanyl-D-alanine carboxypeptidase [Clostridiales bacterium]|nr:D-alanyl-D-alanine carboxypeptidase [Clostridiales bacterium]